MKCSFSVVTNLEDSRFFENSHLHSKACGNKAAGNVYHAPIPKQHHGFFSTPQKTKKIIHTLYRYNINILCPHRWFQSSRKYIHLCGFFLSAQWGHSPQNVLACAQVYVADQKSYSSGCSSILHRYMLQDMLLHCAHMLPASFSCSQTIYSAHLPKTGH